MKNKRLADEFQDVILNVFEQIKQGKFKVRNLNKPFRFPRKSTANLTVIK